MKQQGDLYETMATEYMRTQGVRIVARNIRYRSGEIDIVGQDTQGTWLFIEVKGRKNNHFGNPAEFVDMRKQQKLLLAAQQYLTEHDLLEANCRFDVLAITGIPSAQSQKKIFKPKIDENLSFDWIQNAFTL